MTNTIVQMLEAVAERLLQIHGGIYMHTTYAGTLAAYCIIMPKAFNDRKFELTLHRVFAQGNLEIKTYSQNRSTHTCSLDLNDPAAYDAIKRHFIEWHKRHSVHWCVT